MSAWKFVTCNGGGLTIGFIGGEGGSVTLAEPATEREVKFVYGALGGSVGAKLKLPKIGRVELPKLPNGKPVGGTASAESFYSRGFVTVAPSFTGSELKVRDIEGGCSFLELSGGLGAGGAGYAMGFGMSVAALTAGIANPALMTYAQSTARGYIVFGGVNVGLQAGLSVGAFVGYMNALG